MHEIESRRVDEVCSPRGRRNQEHLSNEGCSVKRRIVSVSFACGLLVWILVSATPAQAAPDDTTADAVIGQNDFASNQANQGGAAGTAATLNGNRGIAISPTDGRLWVADTSNNRVLSWSSPASFANGDSADIVLGQDNFTDIAENKGAANPSSTSLSGPRSVAVDMDGRLYVADSSNFRILRYDPPIASNQAAVQVFGQPDFNTAVQNNGGTSNTSLGNPDGIAVDSDGNVYLADRNLHRILIFNTPATTNTTADVVLGQVDFNTNTGNQPAGNPANNNLFQPIAVFADADRNLYVCDEGNNRVLLFEPPFTDTQAASKVFGQPNFTTNGSNQGGRSASSMFGPVGAAIDPITGNLYVADPINMRILEFNDPLTGDIVADRVFGQLGDFTTGDVNKGGVSADSINDVGGVAVDADGHLYGSDRLNSRLLRYDAPPPMMDGDGDGVPDDTDNCPTTANADQADADGDGVGDACEAGVDPMPGTECCGGGLPALLPLLLCGWIFRHGRRKPERRGAV